MSSLKINIFFWERRAGSEWWWCFGKMQCCCVLFVSPLETNKNNCQYIKSSIIKTSTTEYTSSNFEKLHKSDISLVEAQHRKNATKRGVRTEDSKVVECFEKEKFRLFHVLIIHRNGAYILIVIYKKENSNLAHKCNKRVVLCQESSVLYGNKICVNTYYYYIAVINNVEWLITGLYHIKCIIVLLMLQISFSKKLLILQVYHKIYKKLHNKVRVVYPLTKWITTSLKKYPSKWSLK